jgi:hypothetical protein
VLKKCIIPVVIVLRCKLENSIKIDVKEIGWKALTGFIYLSTGTRHGFFSDMVTNLGVP